MSRTNRGEDSTPEEYPFLERRLTVARRFALGTLAKHAIRAEGLRRDAHGHRQR